MNKYAAKNKSCDIKVHNNNCYVIEVLCMTGKEYWLLSVTL